MPGEQQQVAANDDGANQFAHEAEQRHARQQTRTAEIQQCRNADQDEGNDRSRRGRAIDAE